jgi:hypothetical protein
MEYSPVCGALVFCSPILFPDSEYLLQENLLVFHNVSSNFDRPGLIDAESYD